jgi:hypothetical protein
VWEPILPTDYSSPGTAVLARLPDPMVSQYWDKGHLFAEQLRHRIESDTGQTQPKCCTSKGVQWNEVAVYNQGAHWDSQLPRAVFLNGPVIRALDFSKVVTDLLSK